jgi:SAM-dependent methyltransferase
MNDAELAITTVRSEHPFDAIAGEYDAHFTQRRLGRWLRAAVHRHLTDLARPGDRVLELGCGTGEDALWLARCGAHVVATDASAAMLAEAHCKAVASGVADLITFAQFDLSEIGPADWEGVETRAWLPARQQAEGHPCYDAVLANFGVLNCLSNRRPLAAVLAQWVRPGGRVALVMMSPICPWEMAWYTMHGQICPAFRRFRSGVEARLGPRGFPGATMPVWYPSPRRLRAEFAPAFQLVHAAGIGVLLPPSYLSHLVDRWPRFFARLSVWERHLAGQFPWTWLADHYLMIFERRPVS